MPNIKNSSSSGSGRQQGGMSRGSQRQQSQQSGKDDRKRGAGKSQNPQTSWHRSQQR